MPRTNVETDLAVLKAKVNLIAKFTLGLAAIVLVTVLLAVLKRVF